MPSYLVTCEHASNHVPEDLQHLFRKHRSTLLSHRGWDPGAREIARRLARRLGAPSILGGISRLVVDLNRSPTNPAVFSAITRTLPADQRRAIVERRHAPHWARVRSAIDRAPPGPIVHVAVHSFVPVLAGIDRGMDVGLLYDPRRSTERRLGQWWRDELVEAAPGLRIRRNAPYRGRDDGLPTALRSMHPQSRYVGFELELSQRLLAAPPRNLVRVLADTLAAAVDGAA